MYQNNYKQKCTVFTQYTVAKKCSNYDTHGVKHTFPMPTVNIIATFA